MDLFNERWVWCGVWCVFLVMVSEVARRGKGLRVAAGLGVCLGVRFRTEPRTDQRIPRPQARAQQARVIGALLFEIYWWKSLQTRKKKTPNKHRLGGKNKTTGLDHAHTRGRAGQCSCSPCSPFLLYSRTNPQKSFCSARMCTTPQCIDRSIGRFIRTHRSPHSLHSNGRRLSEVVSEVSERSCFPSRRGSQKK